MSSVDVFIPVYNDITYLPRAVSSALEQVGVDVRVVVSDNASTDGTSEWLRAQAEKDPRIVVYRNDRNVGLTGNLNRYRDLVEAPYYMLLCSDDILYAPDALKKAADVVAQDPNVVSVYCDLAYIDGRGRRIASRHFRNTGLYSAKEALRASVKSSRNMFGIPLLNRTDALRSLGYPTGITYACDVHLSMQAASYGSVYHIGEMLIGNRYTGGNMTATIMRQSKAEFKALENEFNVPLTATERAVQRASYPIVMLSKRAFMAYARLRK